MIKTVFSPEAKRFADMQAFFAYAKDTSDQNYLMGLIKSRESLQTGESLDDEIQGWQDYHGMGACEKCEQMEVLRSYRDMQVCGECAR